MAGHGHMPAGFRAFRSFSAAVAPQEARGSWRQLARGSWRQSATGKHQLGLDRWESRAKSGGQQYQGAKVAANPLSRNQRRNAAKKKAKKEATAKLRADKIARGDDPDKP